MPNYWMLVGSEENFRITQERGFKIQGVTSVQRRKARRMQPGDRVLYYLKDARAFAATATVTSGYREDHTPIWVSRKQGEDYPLRIDIRPEVALQQEQWLDARQLGPTLEYVRKWPPELWPLAFQEELHLLSQRDFRLIEDEMRKVKERVTAQAGNA